MSPRDWFHRRGFPTWGAGYNSSPSPLGGDGQGEGGERIADGRGADGSLTRRGANACMELQLFGRAGLSSRGEAVFCPSGEVLRPYFTISHQPQTIEPPVRPAPAADISKRSPRL